METSISMRLDGNKHAIPITKNYCCSCDFNCKLNFPYCEGRPTATIEESSQSNGLDFGRYKEVNNVRVAKERNQEGSNRSY